VLTGLVVVHLLQMLLYLEILPHIGVKHLLEEWALDVMRGTIRLVMVFMTVVRNAIQEHFVPAEMLRGAIV